jgi:hypothetical protein
VQKIEIANVEELRAVLGEFGEDALYRGQVEHYGSLHSPSMNTSFDRRGCDPDRMLKWAHYAYYALAPLIDMPPPEQIEFTQAILQHYGWRSFFLDASSWFAGHAFSKETTFDLLEDCFEDPVMLVRDAASYAPSEGEGHLYVLSKNAVAAEGLKCVDLSQIVLPERRPRFHAQAAWLIGPLHGNLPLVCITAYIKGPAEVFRAFAAEAGLTETGRLFPPTGEDPVLDTLLSLPWEKIVLPDEGPSELHIPFYRRALSLPEYFREHRRKILPAHVAFYESVSIADGLSPEEGVHVTPIPEVAMYGHAGVTMSFPRVTAIVREFGKVAFEMDGLVRMPESGHTIHYSKGLHLQQLDDGLIAVSDLVVEHPGRVITGIAVNMGWHYSANAVGHWKRVHHADDCPCPNGWRHEHHLSALTIIEDHLSEQVSKNIASGGQ